MKEVGKYKRNGFLVFFGTITSLIGDEIGSVAISIWVAIQTDNPLSFAVVFSINKFSRIFFSFFSGSIVDSTNKKKVLYVTDFIQGLLYVVLLITVASPLDFQVKIILFSIVNIMTGLCLSLFKPASRAILPEIIPSEKLAKMNSVLEVSRTIVSTLGVLFAGGIVMLFGPFVCIIINASTFFVSAFSEVLIYYEFKPLQQETGRKSKLKNILDGYKYVFSNRVVLLLALVAALSNFISVPIFSNILTYQYKFVFSENLLVISNSNFSFLKSEESFITTISTITFFTVGIGSILGGIFAGNEKKYNLLLAILFQMVSFWAMFLYFSFLPTVPISSNFYFFLALIIFMAILSGLSMGIFNVYVTTLYQLIIEPTFMGRFFAFNTILIQLSSPIAMLLYSTFVKRTGLFTPLYLFSFCISMILFIIVYRNNMAVTQSGKE